MPKLSVQQILQRAATHAKKGETAQARALYQSVLDAFPNNKRAQAALATIGLPKAKPGAAEVNPPKAHIDKLNGLYRQGRFAEVVDGAKQLVRQFPSSFVVWNFLAAASAQCGQNALAAQAYRQAAKLNPDDADIFFSLGVALEGLGKADKAISAYQRALKLKPEHPDALNNYGNILKENNNLDAALDLFQHALKVRPDHAGTLTNLGNTLKERGQIDAAISAYKQALQTSPGATDTIYNLGNAYKQLGQDDAAILQYQTVLGADIGHVDACTNLATVLVKQRRFDDAFAVLRKTQKAAPKSAELHQIIGNLLAEQGKPKEAIPAYQKALSLNPEFAEAMANLGRALRDNGRLDKAALALKRALEMDPALPGVEAQYIHQLQHICDWTERANAQRNLTEVGVAQGIAAPFTLLSTEDAADRHLQRARRWTDKHSRPEQRRLPPPPKTRPKKLRIGYFSADFHDHATMYLMLGMLRHHDRSQFELVAYSYGRNKSGALRSETKAMMDAFHDVAETSDLAISDLVQSHALDIAIDLKGYTKESRSELFGYGLAPIQMSFLGFPGSMGADFIDYIVADPVVIPAAQRENYAEKVIYLPHTYQPNDNERPIAQNQTTRADFGLPEDAFVFCCFNSNYKISPLEFDIWMRVLGQIAGSVLWLIKSNEWAEQNLRKEAEKRGIDAQRIVFASGLPHAEHLARHKHADLFLDTFNYNAHTTTSDALWAGLPVVTKPGAQFAARVAASLLNAVGLPELITEDIVSYEALIVELARNPEKLTALREKLKANRLSTPLYDTKRYTRHFEQGLVAAYDRYWDKKDPQDILVSQDAK